MNTNDYSQIAHLSGVLVKWCMCGDGYGSGNSFLAAVLKNDLAGAVSKADSRNLPLIPVIVSWLFAYAPAVSWGSVEKWNAWAERGGMGPDLAGRVSALQADTLKQDYIRTFKASAEA